MSNIIKSLINISLFILLVSCTGTGNSAEKADLTVAEAKKLIDKNKDNPDFVILDVRTPAEVDAGHIPGMINIDLSAPDFRDRVAGLDMSKTYLLYCRTQNRSAAALAVMKSLGFKKLHYMQGGFREWMNAGYENE